MGTGKGSRRRPVPVKRKRRKQEPPELPTLELSQHHVIAPEPIMGRGHAVRARVLDEAEIDRMLMDERITLDEHNVLEEMLRDFHAARMVGSRISRYEPTIPTNDPQGISARAAIALSKVGKLQSLLDAKHGVPARMMVVRLVTIDVPVSKSLDPLLRQVLKTANQFYLDWRVD